MTINSLNFDAQALREKILDLAMRGKLVKQDPNDEPASVLVDKIKAEKEQLVKEKKIKKSKPLPPITDEEKPFDIPDSWEWVRLGDVTNIGNTVSVKPEDIEIGKPLIELADIESYSARLISREKTTANIKSNKLKYHKGDILFAKLRPYLRKILIAPNDGYSTSELLPINGYILNNHWIYASLLSSMFFKQIEKHVQGINLPRVNPTKMKSMIIPLPPLEEQSRIADKIEQLFALLRKVESSSDQYNELQKILHDKVLDLAMRGKLVEQDPNDEPASVLLEKIKAEKAQLVKEKKIKKSKPLPPITDEEKPFEIPDSWEWVRLDEIVALNSNAIKRGPFGSAITKSMFVPKSKDTYKVYEQGNAIRKTTAYGSYFITADKFKELEKFKVKSGDILISCAGTVGETYIVPTGAPAGIINQAMMKISLNSSVIDNQYFQYLFKTKLNLLRAKARGTAIKNMVSVKYLKKEVLWQLPPLEEQKRIVERIKYFSKL